MDEGCQDRVLIGFDGRLYPSGDPNAGWCLDSSGLLEELEYRWGGVTNAPSAESLIDDYCGAYGC